MDFHKALLRLGRNAYADEQLSSCMSRMSRAYAQFRDTRRALVPSSCNANTTRIS